MDTETEWSAIILMHEDAEGDSRPVCSFACDGQDDTAAYEALREHAIRRVDELNYGLPDKDWWVVLDPVCRRAYLFAHGYIHGYETGHVQTAQPGSFVRKGRLFFGEHNENSLYIDEEYWLTAVPAFGRPQGVLGTVHEGLRTLVNGARDAHPNGLYIPPAAEENGQYVEGGRWPLGIEGDRKATWDEVERAVGFLADMLEV